MRGRRRETAIGLRRERSFSGGDIPAPCGGAQAKSRVAPPPNTLNDMPPARKLRGWTCHDRRPPRTRRWPDFPRPPLRRSLRRRGRSGVQHLDDRLPGDPRRPILRRPDRGDDLPDDRELRHRARGLRVAQAVRRGVGGARAEPHREQLAPRAHPRRLPRRAWRSGLLRLRYARAGAPPARPGLEARRDRERSAGRGRAGRARTRREADGGLRSRERCDHRQELRLDEAGLRAARERA